MKDVMIDFETFATGTDASVVQIGACFFDRDTGEIGETFKKNVHASSSGVIDAETVYWWLQRENKAIASIIADPKMESRWAFDLFNGFLIGAESIWSHATFDFVILTETLKRHKIKPSFSYRSARDLRTLFDLTKFDIKSITRDGTHHDGLDDCLFQVKCVVEAFKKMKGPAL